MLAIGRPLVGNFATKNVVYAMIARNWAEGLRLALVSDAGLPDRRSAFVAYA